MVEHTATMRSVNFLWSVYNSRLQPGLRMLIFSADGETLHTGEISVIESLPHFHRFSLLLRIANTIKCVECYLKGVR